ncbi:hypothetical protein IJ182_01555 [bacterium]|nr:hypothetical protein [bacterium]
MLKDNKLLFGFILAGTVSVIPAWADEVYGSLYDAIHDEINQTRTYSLQADETIEADLGELAGENADLTINGNSNYSIVGNGKSGITVGSGKTLNINNVGSLNSDGTVNAAWKDFKETVFNINGGTLNFTGNNVISGNSSTNQSVSMIVVDNGGKIDLSQGATLNLFNNEYKMPLLLNQYGTVSDLNLAIKNNTMTGKPEQYGIIDNHSTSGHAVSMGKIAGVISNNIINVGGNNIRGGVIHNYSESSAIMGDITAELSYNEINANNGIYGGIIRNIAENGEATLGNVTGSIHHNTLTTDGIVYGMLYSNKATGKTATVGNLSGDIEYNTVIATGSSNESTGLISNEGNQADGGGTAQFGNISSNFTHNTITAVGRELRGGLIYNSAKSHYAYMGDITGNMTDNTFTVKAFKGGLIANISENVANSDATMGIISSNTAEII